MKRKLKSALSLLLCMIMVFGAVAVGEENLELRVDLAPVSAPSCPFFRDIDLCEIQHFQKRVVIRKYRPVF